MQFKSKSKFTAALNITKSTRSIHAASSFTDLKYSKPVVPYEIRISSAQLLHETQICEIKTWSVDATFGQSALQTGIKVFDTPICFNLIATSQTPYFLASLITIIINKPTKAEFILLLFTYHCSLWISKYDWTTYWRACFIWIATIMKYSLRGVLF